MTTGELLKKLRTEKGMTQEEVAIRLGMSHNTYVRYENDLRTPKLDATAKLCAFYGLTPAELASGNLEKKEKQFHMPSDEELQFALFGSENVTREDFEEVKRYAQFLIARKKGMPN